LLRALAIASLNACTFPQAEALGGQLLRLAEDQGDPILLVEAHYVQGVTLFWTGSFMTSRTHLEEALALYDPTRSAEHISRYSQDPSVICQCRLAFDLWCLGYPNRARAVQAEGLRRARALAHPFSLAYALTWDAMLHGMMGDFDALLRSTDAVTALGVRHPLGLWSAWATVLHGWGVAEMGDPKSGIAALQRGNDEMGAVGAYFLAPFVSALLAEQFARLGDVDHGLALLAEALASADDERSWYGAEVQRLRGQLLLRQSGESGDAEAAYRRAVQIARSQRARPFELRAAQDLAELAQ
jgi:adenylate cyclase